MIIENKYSKWYYSIIKKAVIQERKRLSRESGKYIYYEKHHILPKCLDGSNEAINLVLLTGKEHFICHLLLPKMVNNLGEKAKLINALIKMVFAKSKGQKRYTSKSYELIRKMIAEKNSIMFKGKKKSLQMRKRLSKTRTGMKFSESHRKNLGIANSKRIGEKNPFFGKHHTKKSMDKRTATRKKNGWPGKVSTKGYKWYNDGNIESISKIPIFGWKPGRIGWKKS